MAHYAFLDENNIVIQVITGRNEHEVIDGISDWELYYSEIHGNVCKRTSYNTYGGENKNGGTAFRYNYAGIGYSYDEARDAFISPKPYDSWILDEDTCLWNAPIPRPEGNILYFWNEETLSWDEINGN
jgi:hypothetical protein